MTLCLLECSMGCPPLQLSDGLKISVILQNSISSVPTFDR